MAFYGRYGINCRGVIPHPAFFRVDTDTHFDTYVISNLAHSVFVLAGWSAFAALTVRSLVPGTPLWLAAILWLVGLLSSHVAFMVLTSFYPGQV